ncbi:C40 family peptidase [Pseudokineococcus marinus]|uniref:C40 family peptidase n=1 Tax=Pseudokineococcus marinus TaxID=351215 RepID=A0A849BSI5_9ACTN|nr:C40 family peptidase [Pseudokineococcus marinus]NNH24525.1 C40 family peptidase [Pseudokineococcus marinus]
MSTALPSSVLRAPARALLVLVASLALLAGFSAGPAAPRAEAAVSLSVSDQALRSVATRAGMPYVYGATGPTRFDCSGLTQWSYRQAGVAIPRTAAQQAAASTRVSRPRVGDLVFFYSSSGSVYHVGIYAGYGQVWDAPKPGRVVSKRKIWTSAVFYGRP